MLGKLPPKRDDLDRERALLEQTRAELDEVEGKLTVARAELAEHEGYVEVTQWVSAATGQTMKESDALLDPERTYPRTVRYKPHTKRGAKGQFVKRDAPVPEPTDE